MNILVEGVTIMLPHHNANVKTLVKMANQLYQRSRTAGYGRQKDFYGSPITKSKKLGTNLELLLHHERTFTTAPTHRAWIFCYLHVK